MNASRGKCSILQEFLKTGEQPRHYGSDFARRRAWVRIPSAPLLNFLQTTKKLKILVVTPRAPCSNRAATRTNNLKAREKHHKGNSLICSSFASSGRL